MFWKREGKACSEDFDMLQQLLEVDLQNLMNAIERKEAAVLER